MSPQQLFLDDIQKDLKAHGQDIAVLQEHKTSTNEVLKEIKGELRWMNHGMVAVLFIAVLNLGILLYKAGAPASMADRMTEMLVTARMRISK